MADGNQKKADYFYNTNYWNYYYRKEQLQIWIKEQEKRMEELKNQNK